MVSARYPFLTPSRPVMKARTVVGDSSVMIQTCRSGWIAHKLRESHEHISTKFQEAKGRMEGWTYRVLDSLYKKIDKKMAKRGALMSKQTDTGFNFCLKYTNKEQM